VAPKGFTPDGRRVADPGRRLLGLLVDLAIWTGPQVLLIVALAVLLIAGATPSDAAGGGAELPASTVITIVGLYALVFVLGIAKVAVEAEKVCRSGQTWGMKALRLRAIDGRTGGSITRGRAWGRAAFAAMVSGQLFGIGYWWAFFDDRKRTLHDLVTSTVVIDER
jgi:uncharacterized RDD family membrane protein YckC